MSGSERTDRTSVGLCLSPGRVDGVGESFFLKPYCWGSEVTDCQAKVLNFIRSRGGSVSGHSLTTYQYRSVWPLVQAGYLVIVPCGQCPPCNLNRLNGTDYSCYHNTIRTRDGTSVSGDHRGMAPEVARGPQGGQTSDSPSVTAGRDRRCDPMSS